MQLMKYTAKIVAKQAKLPYSISGLTNDPIYNIKLGTYYFIGLLTDYNGIYPFAWVVGCNCEWINSIIVS